MSKNGDDDDESDEDDDNDDDEQSESHTSHSPHLQHDIVIGSYSSPCFGLCIPSLIQGPEPLGAPPSRRRESRSVYGSPSVPMHTRLNSRAGLATLCVNSFEHVFSC